MKNKFLMPILALLCASLVIPTASARGIPESGSFTVTASGIGRRLSGFACGSGSGLYYALWADLNPVDGVYETLIELHTVFIGGSLRTRWYDGSWHRSTMSLTGILGDWYAPEISGSGNVWTITDSGGAGTFTITWNAGPFTGATIRGSIKLLLDGVTITLCIRGTANSDPV